MNNIKESDDPLYQKLLKNFMDLCDSLVSEAYVVTNGLRVSAIVLDKKIAEFLCKEMRKKYNSDRWVYLPTPQAIEYAFECGRDYAFAELIEQQNNLRKAEQPVDDSVKEKDDGENSKLRESDVQPEEKSN